MKRGKPLRSRAPCPICKRQNRTICVHKGDGGAQLRRTPLRHNAEGKRESYERDFGDWADTIRAMPCWWCKRRAPSDPAHTLGRKMGGAGGDRRYLLPMCGNDPATGHVGCHHKYDNYELGVDHNATRLQALRLFLREHPEDAVAAQRIEELTGRE